MLAESISPHVDAGLVYTKTDGGRAELAQRSAGLGARQRSVLIMIDGQKPCSALAGLAPPERLAGILAELEALGMIVAARAPASAASKMSAPKKAGIDPTLLSNAKRLLIATAETYLGLLSADVVRKVQAAADEEQLLRALGQWHMAMQASRQGRTVAHTYLDQIKASLAGTGAAPLQPA